MLPFAFNSAFQDTWLIVSWAVQNQRLGMGQRERRGMGSTGTNSLRAAAEAGGRESWQGDATSGGPAFLHAYSVGPELQPCDSRSMENLGFWAKHK